MPRQGRLNVPGMVHHIIVRGIERRAIFLDEEDRHDFLARLETGLLKTQCRCCAWVLMSNHFHLLLRTSSSPLSDLMRGLLSGYAVAFNRRRHRRGYLFQDRFKSILCQEDAYFMQLVRYIHLNPVRAGMVAAMKELDRYPWSGHAVLIGVRKAPWQNTDEVLGRFSSSRSWAVRRYRQFVEEGWGMGRREDLTGGGLRRSAGGWDMLAARRGDKDYERGDERILGDGAFVTAVLKEAEERLTERARSAQEGWTWERLVEKVCAREGISSESLRQKGRDNAVSKAKEALVNSGIRHLGLRQKDMADQLGISQGALSQIYRRSLDRGDDLNLLS